MIGLSETAVRPSGGFTVGPIHNEQQETMFDSELSQAVDDLVALLRSIKRAKELKDSLESELIKIMKKNKLRSISFPCGTLKIQQSDEKIKVKFDRGFELKDADF